MKNIKIIIAVAIALSIFSCSDDFLDLKQPVAPTLETYYTDTVTAFNGLVGCYNSLQQVPTPERPIGVLFLLDIRSDDTDYAGNPRGATEERNYYNAAGFANFDIYSDNAHAKTLWNYGYRGINTVNKYLEGISVIELSSPSQQALIEQYRSEAKFLRAYFYFQLVKHFGDVPLITRTLDEADWYNQRRIPVKQVYEQIFTDLREAIPNLPLKSEYPKTMANRITKGAAQALLSKTLITEAETDAASKNWQEAFNLCNEIENSGQYNLNTNFKDIFTNANQFSSEVVFDIVFEESISSEIDAYVHYFSPRFLFINGKPDQSEKMKYGFGVYGITEDLANQFGYSQNDDSNTYLNLKDGRGRYTFWAQWDTYCGLNVVDRLTTRPETKNPENPDDANYYSRKYNREAPATNYYVGGKNLHFIRYAEVLLIKAEASYYLNKPDEALRMVNLVRERAFREAITKGSTTLVEISRKSSGTQLLEDIWQERRLEFAGEGDRFYDLKRTKRLHILKEKKPEIFFQAGKHELLPIPSSELSKAPYITQNPGY